MGASKNREVLSCIRMSIFHSAIAEIVARQLPLVQNGLHGFWGSEPALIQSIQPKLTFRRFQFGDLFDPKIFGHGFQFHRGEIIILRVWSRTGTKSLIDKRTT